MVAARGDVRETVKETMRLKKEVLATTNNTNQLWLKRFDFAESSMTLFESICVQYFWVTIDKKTLSFDHHRLLLFKNSGTFFFFVKYLREGDIRSQQSFCFYFFARWVEALILKLKTKRCKRIQILKKYLSIYTSLLLRNGNTVTITTITMLTNTCIFNEGRGRSLVLMISKTNRS